MTGFDNRSNISADAHLEGVIQYFPSTFVRNLINRNVRRSMSSIIDDSAQSNVLYSPLGREVAEAIKKIKQTDPRVISKGLAQIGEISLRGNVNLKDVVPSVIGVLKDNQAPMVRSDAAWTLWKLNDERAIEPLMHALVIDDSILVKDVSARALGLLKAERAISLLAKMLFDKNVPAPVRAGIATALGSYRKPSMLSILSQVVTDTSPLVRKSTIKSLGAIALLLDFHEEAVLRNLLLPRLSVKKEPDGDIRAEVILALRSVTDQRIIKKAIKILREDKNCNVRKNAAQFLAGIYDDEIESVLIDMLNDENWVVRKNVAISLGKQVKEFGTKNRTKVVEALNRIQRMFPSYSEPWRTADAALDRL